MSQLNPSNVLSADAEINYKQIAQRSPSTSYLHQYDGAVAGAGLRSLHPVGNPKELFTQELQNDVNALMRSDPNAVPVEKLATLAYSRDWYDKINNPASVLEFDTRNMVVPRPPDTPPNDGKPVLPERWVIRPRVALFNSSSMNSIDNEFAQIGSELLAHFGDTEQAKLCENLKFLDNALHYEQGIESTVNLRQLILNGDDTSTVLTAGWPKLRTFWSWLADPVCAVQGYSWAQKQLCDSLHAYVLRRQRSSRHNGVRLPKQLHLGRCGLLQSNVLDCPPGSRGSSVPQCCIERSHCRPPYPIQR